MSDLKKKLKEWDEDLKRVYCEIESLMVDYKIEELEEAKELVFDAQNFIENFLWSLTK